MEAVGKDLPLGTCLQSSPQAWRALAGCHFPSSAIRLSANTTREGVWAVSAKSGLLMHGKGGCAET